LLALHVLLQPRHGIEGNRTTQRCAYAPIVEIVVLWDAVIRTSCIPRQQGADANG
jgi:hypothetical protein